MFVFYLAVSRQNVKAIELTINSVAALGTISVSYIAVTKNNKKPDLSFYLSLANKDGTPDGYDVFAVNTGSTTVISVGDYQEYAYSLTLGLIPHYDLPPEPYKMVVCKENEAKKFFHFDPINSKITMTEEIRSISPSSNIELSKEIIKGGIYNESIDVVDETTNKRWNISVDWEQTTNEGVPYLIVCPETPYN
jgi:hypothetical protein